MKLGQPLMAVLRSLDGSGLAIVLIEDESGLAKGVLTDGDVRRALLEGATLGAPVDSYVADSFFSVTSTTSRADVLDLMQSRRIDAVPILSSDGRFIGLHTLHDLIGSETKPNCAVVMAGGRGERLRPLTDSIPKPMVKVAGRPILERIVLHLVGCGIRNIFISVNYRAEAIEAYFLDGAPFGCTIKYLREQMPLGTGGSLSLLPQLPTHPTLVLNGDLVTQFDVTRMLAFHQEGGYRATVGTHEYSHTVPLGVVEVDGDHINQIREKPTQVWRVNAGIYIVDPELVRRVPADTNFELPALIEECLELGEPVGAFHIREDWADIGRHHELKRARGQE